ncbi:MAG: 50S ribosomal protein L14e [Firmicutes bacterium ADurb.Bin182]|nr:MAG: 50S ribosomal protein L14e [Firmicutes bacterium ADurb.Bin182]
MDENLDLIGRIATSRAGRDKNRSFVIVDVLDNEYVAIADGMLRKLAKPKKKKLKHLFLQRDSAVIIKQRLSEGQQVLDAQIRDCLLDLGYNRDKQDQKEG